MSEIQLRVEKMEKHLQVGTTTTKTKVIGRSLSWWVHSFRRRGITKERPTLIVKKAKY